MPLANGVEDVGGVKASLEVSFGRGADRLGLGGAERHGYQKRGSLNHGPLHVSCT